MFVLQENMGNGKGNLERSEGKVMKGFMEFAAESELDLERELLRTSSRDWEKVNLHFKQTGSTVKAS